MQRSPAALAPATYLCAPGAVEHLGEITSTYGRRALVVHGEIGYALVRGAVDEAMRASGVDLEHAQVLGPCTVESIDATASAARRSRCDVLVAIGGGRVLDVSKAAAVAAGVPCITVPTSPATCAAVRAHTVLYTAAGTPSGARPLPEGPAACIIDLDVVTAAPPRLLAAGLLDAVAKWYELDLLHSRTPLMTVGGRSAHALARTILEEVERSGARAVAEVRSGSPGRAAADAAEVAILLPGLVSGLAGGNNAMAVAHAVHDALTFDPGAHSSLHGELVGFGLVVQALLADEAGTTASRLRSMLIDLGAPRTLDDLGCRETRRDRCASVALRLSAAPALQRAFGQVPSEQIAELLMRADASLR
jgi:glycerol dehydrogenase-like iron-containing ADH family enzyme